MADNICVGREARPEGELRPTMNHSKLTIRKSIYMLDGSHRGPILWDVENLTDGLKCIIGHGDRVGHGPIPLQASLYEGSDTVFDRNFPTPDAVLAYLEKFLVDSTMDQTRSLSHRRELARKMRTFGEQKQTTEFIRS